jgi:hypothetical protein
MSVGWATAVEAEVGLGLGVEVRVGVAAEPLTPPLGASMNRAPPRATTAAIATAMRVMVDMARAS